MQLIPNFSMDSFVNVYHAIARYGIELRREYRNEHMVVPLYGIIWF